MCPNLTGPNLTEQIYLNWKRKRSPAIQVRLHPPSSVFTYNNRNQLKTVAAGNAGSEIGQGQYHYNYTGMRIRHLGSTRGDYGIGTGYEADGTPYDINDSEVEDRITREVATGQSMNERVEWMMQNLEKRLKTDKVVDVFGFSRGGASAVDFLNRIQDQIDKKNPLYKDIEIRFAGIFDAVPSKRNSLLSYSNENLSGRKINSRGRVTYSKPDFRFALPKDMKFTNQPVHIIAIDERRAQFAVADLKGAKQVGFAGVHSDVGGWYQNSRFDWLARDYMVNEAKKYGLKFNQNKLESFARFGETDYNKWLASGKNKYHRNRTEPTDNSGNFWINDDEDRALPEGLLLHPSVDYFPESKLNNVADKEYLK